MNGPDVIMFTCVFFVFGFLVGDAIKRYRNNGR